MDIQELKKQLNYLEETKQLIKEQLVAKGQPVDDNTTFREYVDNMNDLVDTTDANAIDSDLALDKTAYVNGNKITGTLETADAISIDNSKNTDTYLMLIDMGNIPSMVVGADINNLYGVRKIVEDETNLEIIAPQSQIADAISLTTDKIKAGETILGITGKSSVVDTDDANATAGNIIADKTAYVNGRKVIGTIPTVDGFHNATNSQVSYNGTNLFVMPVVSQVRGYYCDDTEMKTFVTVDIIANKIGLTANMIKQGVTVLGVAGSVVELNGDTETVTPTTSQQIITPTSPKNALTQVTVNAVTSAIDNNIQAGNIKSGVTILGVQGTYVGSTMKEYASVTDMNNDIANIGIDEVVKVVESGTTSYYIKEIIDNVPTMTKLVKESETMSPQEYSDANDIADEILGE